jgi:transcriptional regulator with XRE-family HTH domain
MGKEASYSIIKNSPTIKKCLKARFAELNITMTHVVKDARSRGVLLENAALARFLKGRKENVPSEEKIIWLCIRYGIKIQLIIGDTVRESDGTTVFKLLPYNEEGAMNVLAKMFPDKHKIIELNEKAGTSIRK